MITEYYSILYINIEYDKTIYLNLTHQINLKKYGSKYYKI